MHNSASFPQTQLHPTNIDAPGTSVSRNFGLQPPISDQGPGHHHSTRPILGIPVGYLPLPERPSQAIQNENEYALKRDSLNQDYPGGQQSYDLMHNHSKRRLDYVEDEEQPPVHSHSTRDDYSPEQDLDIANKSREERRKIVSTVVIACRQWYVSPNSPAYNLYPDFRGVFSIFSLTLFEPIAPNFVTILPGALAVLS
jgi:hypothetical protein